MAYFVTTAAREHNDFEAHVEWFERGEEAVVVAYCEENEAEVLEVMESVAYGVVEPFDWKAYREDHYDSDEYAEARGWHTN